MAALLSQGPGAGAHSVVDGMGSKHMVTREHAISLAAKAAVVKKKKTKDATGAQKKTKKKEDAAGAEKKKVKKEEPASVKDAAGAGEVPQGLGAQHPPVLLHFRPSSNTQPPKQLQYFCLQGLGETARLLLEATNTPYDSIMHFGGTQMKRYAPFGQMPLYQGKELGEWWLSQSGSICRHIARTVGAAGKNAAEQAKADAFYELAKDISSKKAAIHDPKHGDAGKLEMFLNAAEAHAPKKPEGYWVGSDLTLADVAMFHILYHFQEVKPKSIDAYPRLTAFTSAFARRPEIKSYLASDRRVPLTANEIGDKPWFPEGYKYQTPLRRSVIATTLPWNKER